MIIYIDIDETICYYDSTRDYKLAQPYLHRIAKINRLYNEGNEIHYWTARGTLSNIDYYELTYNQLKKWGASFHSLKMGKPAYDLFIDDKNINSDYFFDNHIL